jgi:hypothetical protein
MGRSLNDLLLLEDREPKLLASVRVCCAWPLQRGLEGFLLLSAKLIVDWGAMSA